LRDGLQEGPESRHSERRREEHEVGEFTTSAVLQEERKHVLNSKAFKS